jgi:hypothetical protein
MSSTSITVIYHGMSLTVLYIMVRTINIQWDDEDVRIVLDQYA